MKNKIQIYLLFFLLLVSAEVWGQSVPTICYKTVDDITQNILTFPSQDAAKLYVEDHCLGYISRVYDCGPNGTCIGKYESWTEKDVLGTYVYSLSFVIPNHPNYPGGINSFGICSIVTRHSGYECDLTPTPTPTPTPIPTPIPDPTQDTIIDTVTISQSGLDMTSKSGVDLAKNGSPLNTKNCPEQCSNGDPVNFSTGLMWHQEMDFVLKGKTSLTDLFFTRTYVAHPVLSNGGMGTHWFHNYQTKIFPLRVNGVNHLIWLDENGGPRVFLNNGDNTYKNPASFSGALVEYTDRYELTKSNKVKLTFTKNISLAPFGSLVLITEPHGEQVHFTYNSLGLLASVETGLAGRILLNYNASNLLTQVLRERDNLSYKYIYDLKGNILSVTDFNGKKTTYTYQSSNINYLDGLMLSVTDPLGRKTSFQYDDKGRAISETEPGNVTRYYTYNIDAAGVHSTLIQEIDGSKSNFFFDSNYLFVKRVGPDGSIVQRTWNNKILVNSTTDELGFKTSFQYDFQNNLSYVKRAADKNPTIINYDLNFNKPRKIIPAIGSPIDFRINQSTGDVLEVVRNNLSLKFINDNFGNILTTDNGVTTYSDQTNSNGLKTFIFDARNPETLSYDNRGRVITRSFKSGRVLNYSFDNYDRIVQIKDSHGPTVKNTYDLLGRLLTREIAGSKNKEITKYDWDIRGRLVQITDNFGRKTKYQYNAANSSTLAIDKPSTIIAPDGKVTLFKYDIMQRLIQKIDALKTKTSFEYNLRGDLTKLTDAKGSFTIFSYDGNKRLIKQDAPTVLTDIKGISSGEREVAQYFYNDQDQLIKIEKSLASGSGKKTVTLLSYNPLGRLIKKTMQKIDQTENIIESKASTFSYESILEAELLKTADNEVSKLSFTYENLPPFKIIATSTKATDTSNPLGLLENDLVVTRDYSGEIATLKSTNGATLILNQFDPAGRLIKTSSGDFLGTAAPKFESVLIYDDLGRKTNVANSDGFNQTINFDQLSRVNSINWKKGNVLEVSEQIAYDLAGNLVNSKRENADTVFGYDQINQLTSEHSQHQSREMQYDLMGNRIKDSYNGVASFINNAITRDQKEVHSYNTYAYDLDGLGNLTTIVNEKDKTQKDFEYNLDNKLSTFQLSLAKNGDSLFTTYYFDALNRRVAKNIQINKNKVMISFSRAFLH